MKKKRKRFKKRGAGTQKENTEQVEEKKRHVYYPFSPEKSKGCFGVKKQKGNLLK